MPGRLSILVVLVLFPACSGIGPTPLARVPIGDWGGDHIRLRVADLNATTEFDCAHGTLDQPLLLDRDAHFDVAGTFVREHGGPIRLGEPPDSHPARYKGVIDGNAMSLTVTLTDQPQEIGAFSLKFAAPARIVKCL